MQDNKNDQIWVGCSKEDADTLFDKSNGLLSGF